MSRIRSFCIASGFLAGLYLFMTGPRMFGRPKAEPHLNCLYAHRGLFDNASDAPENTMAAFRKAVDAGYGIECDVQLSKDGVPVIFHDFTLKRMARYPLGKAPIDAPVCEDGSIGVKGKVCDYTFEELQQFHILDSDQRIPRFRDFLELVDGKVPLIVELKIEREDISVCKKADELLGSYRGIYCIESFNPLGVLWYRLHRPGVMRGQLSDEFHLEKPDEYSGAIYFFLTYLFFNFLGRPDFIAFNHKYPGNLSLWLNRHLFKGLSAAWTVKSQWELEEARKNFDIFIFDSFVPQLTTEKR